MSSSRAESPQERLTRLRSELLQEQEAAQESAAPVELDQTRVGRLSRMDSMQQQAMAVEQNRRRDIQLQRIEGAFQRLERGTYGLCVTCGEAISEERIDFDPTIFFCQGCAAKAEKR